MKRKQTSKRRSFVDDLNRLIDYYDANGIKSKNITINISEAHARRKLKIPKRHVVSHRGRVLDCRGSAKWRAARVEHL